MSEGADFSVLAIPGLRTLMVVSVGKRSMVTVTPDEATVIEAWWGDRVSRIWRGDLDELTGTLHLRWEKE